MIIWFKCSPSLLFYKCRSLWILFRSWRTLQMLYPPPTPPKKALLTQRTSYYWGGPLDLRSWLWHQIPIPYVCYISLRVEAFWFPKCTLPPPSLCLCGVTPGYLCTCLRLHIIIKSIRITCQKWHIEPITRTKRHRWWEKKLSSTEHTSDKTFSEDIREAL